VERKPSISGLAESLAAFLEIKMEIPHSVDDNQSARKGFSLAEVLIGLSIIALLTGMGFSGARIYRDRAREVKCLYQIRGIGNALQVYGAEHDGFLPSVTEDNVELGDEDGVGALDIRFELYSYDSSLWSITCPSDQRNKANPDPTNPSYISYSYHPTYGLNLERCLVPSPLVSDAIYFHGRDKKWKRSVVFSDNHAEMEPW
jgi:prepilin-type N-terminal cleavage/methylation domain-containing protein